MSAPGLPGIDILVLIAPFLAILAMGMTGLDERFANPHRNIEGRRFFCEVDDRGRSFLSDPDGKLWRQDPKRQFEGKLTLTSKQQPDKATRRHL